MLEPISKYSGGRNEAEDIYWLACSGKAQLWLCSVEGQIVAACVTEIKEYPAATSLDVLFVGGKKLGDWVAQLIEKLERYAKFARCSRIEMAGRPGWLRILNRYGFSHTPAVFMEKAV